jgi:hypothetical protein
VFDDHGPGHSPSGIAHQVFQQCELLGGEFNGLVAARDPALHPIELEIFHGEHRLGRKPAPPEQSTQPRREFRE